MGRNIRMHIREVGWEGVDWIHLAQNTDQWRPSVLCEGPNEKLHGFCWAGKRSCCASVEMKILKYLENQQKGRAL
jgi:hypothetical protein